MEEPRTTEEKFKEELVKMHGQKYTFLQKAEYFELIEELKQAIVAKGKTRRQYYFLKRYEFYSFLIWSTIHLVFVLKLLVH